MKKKLLLVTVFLCCITGLTYADIVQLSPKMRELSSNEHGDLLANWDSQFLDIQIIKDPKLVSTFPRVISDKTGKVMSTSDDEVYVDKLSKLNYLQPLAVYRIGKPITKPNSNDIVGYPFYYLSNADLLKLDVDNELSLVKLSAVDKEVIIGDRILNKYRAKPKALRKNKNELNGNILSVVNGVNNADAGQTIIIELGKNSEIREGDLLSVEREVSFRQSVQLHEEKHFTRDHFLNKKRDKNAAKKLNLPSENIATILVYRVFDDTSLALVVDNHFSVGIKDKVVGYKKLTKKT